VKGLTREQLAARVARDIPPNSFVNLGIGLPTLVGDHLPAGRDVIFHSENGILNLGPRPPAGEEDRDLINAGKTPITILPGGSYFDTATSFAMMRGGHLDISVLGAFEVSGSGDIANWTTDDGKAPPAVGGAMDLACGAKAIWVIMEHLTKDGQPRILQTCRMPLTAQRVVTRIYTDLAVIERKDDQLHVIDLTAGVTFDRLQRLTPVPLHDRTRV
jgi:3-oxoadipate CoA-transferase beta subunit